MEGILKISCTDPWKACLRLEIVRLLVFDQHKTTKTATLISKPWLSSSRIWWDRLYDSFITTMDSNRHLIIIVVVGQVLQHPTTWLL